MRLDTTLSFARELIVTATLFVHTQFAYDVTVYRIPCVLAFRINCKRHDSAEII
jgi:hypothetical protein